MCRPRVPQTQNGLILQNVHAQHPPHKEEGDDGHYQVANPLPDGFRFSAVLHGVIVAGWGPLGAVTRAGKRGPEDGISRTSPGGRSYTTRVSARTSSWRTRSDHTCSAARRAKGGSG
jgi:hypothetical protein